MAEKLGSASSPSNKRMKKAEIDRLSALPDSLLISILSLLSTLEAIRTCVLSRRWYFLWTDLPALAFKEESDGIEKLSKFVVGVHKYIGICGGNHLQKFEVSFNYKERFASDVNAWVRFALKHKVKDVALLLQSWRLQRTRYLPPQMMYSNSCLTRLSLHGCIMAPKNTIQWGVLSSLYLKYVELRGDAIDGILLNCPVLYDLTLWYCSHSSKLDRLHVKSQSLRELALIGWDFYDLDVFGNLSMEVSAPFIHYAKISPYVEGRKFQLTNISSLIEADIDFEVQQPDAISTWTGYTGRLFENLRHVKKLKVGPKLIQALGDMVVQEGMQLSQSRVECLQLNATISNEETINGIVCLLESSPNLKKLVISLWCDICQDGSEKKIELNCDLLHLKTVTIMVHEDPECVAKTLQTLVQLLFKRATVLEKLAIDFSPTSMKYCTPPEFTKIALTLLSYPRASTKVAVELSPFCS